MFRTIIVLMLTVLFSCSLGVEADTPADGSGAETPAAVLHEGQRLFIYYSTLDGLKPTERASRTAEIVRELADDQKFDSSQIHVKEVPEGTAVVYGNKVIATATISDAKVARDSTRQMAAQFASKLRSVLTKRVEELTAGKIAFASGLTVAMVLVFMMSIAIICRVIAAVVDRIKKWQDSIIKSVKIQEAELLSSKMLTNLLVSGVQVGQMFLIGICFYFALLVVLDTWPATKDLAETVRETSWYPVVSVFEGIVGYLPKLLVIVVIVVATQGILAFARFFFDALEAGSIRFSGFDRDWAKPSYTLVRLLVIALALVLALPYFPGWESDAFKQVGLLLGLLISLGSSQIVGHVIGGTVLTYSNAFKTGDRIKIGNHTGDVLEKTVFVTRIMTPKNEIVSIPNGQVLGSDIVNYSKMATTGELVLYTQVTIGYDAPWRKVRDLLLAAANKTPGIVKEPAPFVLATELGDFTITYELNTHTDVAGAIPATYSRLHECILDAFNEAGLEIMSPHIYGIRDGNFPALPEENVAKEHKQRPFVVSVTKD